MLCERWRMHVSCGCRRKIAVATNTLTAAMATVANGRSPVLKFLGAFTEKAPGFSRLTWGISGGAHTFRRTGSHIMLHTHSTAVESIV